MRNAQGVGIITGPNGQKTEIDTFTCCHCNSIVHVPTGSKPDDFGSWCTMCHAMHCSRNGCQTCVPFEKKMERLEASARARRSYGL